MLWTWIDMVLCTPHSSHMLIVTYFCHRVVMCGKQYGRRTVTILYFAVAVTTHSDWFNITAYHVHAVSQY